MTLEMMRPCADSLPAGWRGPNDPPGTRFRGEQTFALYGYYPRDVIEIPAIDAEFLPLVEPTPAFETCPVLALIESRILVDDCIGNRGDWSIDEIRPYVVELQTSLDSLKTSLDDAEAFERFLAREGLS